MPGDHAEQFLLLDIALLGRHGRDDKTQTDSNDRYAATVHLYAPTFQVADSGGFGS